MMESLTKVNPSIDSSVRIEERAAEWLAKRDGGEWSASDEVAFGAWLEQSTLHVVAFVRLEAAWAEAKRLKALGTGVKPGTVPSPEEWQLTPFLKGSDVPASEAPLASVDVRQRGSETPSFRTPPPLRRWALAAGLVLAIGASVVSYIRPWDSTYRTPVGGIASVPMSDGSKVTLNTDSRIRLAVSESERRVELERGEAFFEVTKDPKRPFVVVAGDKRIVAVGTEFSVRRTENDVRVLITEGRVAIEVDEPTEERGGPAHLVLLSAGSVARASDTGVLIQEQTVPEVEGYLSWRTGYLTFRDIALADAIAEFNRYNTQQVIVEDPAIAAIRVSGRFRSTGVDAFVRLMEDGFPIHAQRVNRQIVLTARRGAADTTTR